MNITNYIKATVKTSNVSALIQVPRLVPSNLPIVKKENLSKSSSSTWKIHYYHHHHHHHYHNNAVLLLLPLLIMILKETSALPPIIKIGKYTVFCIHSTVQSKYVNIYAHGTISVPLQSKDTNFFSMLVFAAWPETFANQAIA